MKVKKIRQKATIPRGESLASAGRDIWGVFDEPIEWHEPHSVKMLNTGFATEFDANLVARVWERGSTGSRNLQVRAGVVDSNFRGEWKIFLTNGNPYPYYYIEGEERDSVFEEHVQSLRNLYEMTWNRKEDEVVYESGLIFARNKVGGGEKILAGVYPQSKAIAQFVMIKIDSCYELEVVDELSQTSRGEGMLGSSGH
jgi:dUTPase